MDESAHSLEKGNIQLSAENEVGVENVFDYERKVGSTFIITMRERCRGMPNGRPFDNQFVNNSWLQSPLPPEVVDSLRLRKLPEGEKWPVPTTEDVKLARRANLWLAVEGNFQLASAQVNRAAVSKYEDLNNLEAFAVQIKRLGGYALVEIDRDPSMRQELAKYVLNVVNSDRKRLGKEPLVLEEIDESKIIEYFRQVCAQNARYLDNYIEDTYRKSKRRPSE